MVQVTKREEVLAYFKSPALGQSTLKKLLSGIDGFHNEFDSSAEHFLIGSAVDCILTGNPEEFDSLYYISNIEKKPSDTVMDILKLVHTMLLHDYAEFLEVTDPVIVTENQIEVTQDALVKEAQPFVEFVGNLFNWEAYILDACKIVDWNRTWGDAAKIKNILPHEDFFLDLCQSYGKEILSSTQKNLIDNIIASLRTNPRTQHYFDRDTLADLSTITVYYQFPIYFTYREQDCKALLDIVIVERDVEGKILMVHGIDLKTMHGNTYYFLTSLKQRRYDIQAAWYTLALQTYFAIGLEKLAPFQFVVESTTYVGKPLVFELSPTLMKIGRYGRKAITLVETDLFNGSEDAVLQREIKGFEQLLDTFIYHNENGWSLEKEIQETPIGKAICLSWEGFALN